jgi:uncharacterized protein (DUF305 family)
MAITVDKKTGILIGIIAVLALGIVFLLAGNSGQSMDHSGHDGHNHDMEMGGMLTAEELETLASLKGEAFDQFFLASMIAHHEGALDIVDMINDSTNSDVKTLAANIVKSQSAEIEAMKALLK